MVDGGVGTGGSARDRPVRTFSVRPPVGGSPDPKSAKASAVVNAGWKSSIERIRVVSTPRP